MDRREMRERLQQVLEQYAKSPSWTPRQEIRQPLFWKSIRAEFVGSLILMVFSCSSHPYLGPISYGCTVAVLTYSFKTTSMHFNPAITLAALVLRGLTPFRCLAMILAQTIGTLSGATVISVGLSGNETSLPVEPTMAVNPAKGFGYEFFGMLMVTMAAAPELDSGSTGTGDVMFPLMLGLAVGTGSSFARLGTGGFLNPIRAFSLALFQQNCWPNHYIYWVGPVLGSLLGVFTYDFIRPSRPRATATHMNTSTRLKQDSDCTTTHLESEMTIATLT